MYQIYFPLQCYETRYQLQEKNCKKHKHMEITKHVSKYITEEIKRETKKFLETNDNENTTNQTLWDAANAF